MKLRFSAVLHIDFEVNDSKTSLQIGNAIADAVEMCVRENLCGKDDRVFVEFPVYRLCDSKVSEDLLLMRGGKKDES